MYPNFRTSPFLEEHGGVEGAHDLPFRVASSGSVCAVAHCWSDQSIWTLLAMVTLAASNDYSLISPISSDTHHISRETMVLYWTKAFFRMC